MDTSTQKPARSADDDRKTDQVVIRFTRKTLRRIDNWRRDQPDIPNRPEAIRRLTEVSLDLLEEETEG